MTFRVTVANLTNPQCDWASSGGDSDNLRIFELALIRANLYSCHLSTVTGPSRPRATVEEQVR